MFRQLNQQRSINHSTLVIVGGIQQIDGYPQMIVIKVQSQTIGTVIHVG